MALSALQQSVQLQRKMLCNTLGKPMEKLARRCAGLMHSRVLLEEELTESLPRIFHCKHLYVLNAGGTQITDNITQDGPDSRHFNRNRMSRPYMQNIIGVEGDLKLSEAYISRNKRRPSLTAVKIIRDEQNGVIGFLGADYDLRELPHTAKLYLEPEDWRQIRGDPAIRGGLFMQQRAESVIDRSLDEVFSVLYELFYESGVYHGKIHFSSSRCTIWHVDDPFVYRILSIDELSDPDICLAYPHSPYHPRAVVKPEEIMPVFEMFKQLRFADENIYLRAGSLNIINGMVGLNFSCDGSHYMRFDEFLKKNTEFWFGVNS